MNIIFTILFLFISGTVYAQECTQPSCFQQKDKELTGLANTTSAADRVPWYIDANGNMDLAPFTAFGRSIVGAANAGEVNTILGVSLVTTHPRVTVATLPAVPVTNEVVVVTDALAASSCIVNGGTTNVTCQWTGTAWVAIGGGGGGGSVAGTDTQVQFNDSNIMAGDAGLTYDKASNVLTVTGDVIVAGQSVCQEDGTNCPSGGAPAFNTVTAGTNTDKLVIGTGGTLGVSGTGTITPQYTPSGSIAATTVQGAIAELDAEKQPVDADLTALAGNSNAGFWAAAISGSNGAARTFANGTGIAWTNPGGVAGNPQASVTPTVVMTDRSSTWTTGDVDLRLAASFRFPNATGAAPTTPATCAFDLTSQTYKCGLTNGSTVTLATTGFLSGYQPLHANLTGISSLSGGTGARIPYIDGAGNWGFFTKVLCINSGGNIIHTSSVSPLTETCDVSASGLSGATNNYGLFATGATSFASSDALQLDGSSNVWAKNGLVVGDCTTDCLSLNTSSVTGGKEWIVMNFDGTVRVSTGAFTAGHVVTTDANGLLIDGGAAGAGDVTLNGSQVLTNKTLDVEATGNVITTVSKIWLVAAGGTVAAPGLMWDALPTLAPTAVCSAGTTETTMLRCTADFPDSDGDYSLQQELKLPSDWAGAVDVLIKYRTTATSGDTVWQIATACRADAEVDDVAWNTADVVTADTAKGTTLQLNDAAKTGITMTGCAAGELWHLKILRNRTHASDTIAGVVSLVGAEITLRRAQ